MKYYWSHLYKDEEHNRIMKILPKVVAIAGMKIWLCVYIIQLIIAGVDGGQF